MHCLFIVLSLSLVVTISSQKCPNGWRASEAIPNKCYYVGTQKNIWFDAEAYCKNAGLNAHLTSIASAFENADVDAVVGSTQSAAGCGQFWIGGNDIAQNGNWTWEDGSSWEYSNWGPGQPDLSQQCVSTAALTTGKWKAESCAHENCFICEMYMLPATDCKDWFNYGAHTDGIYSINPDGKGAVNVFCDMTTDGGGWTVFQRRVDGSLSFYDKLWKDYKAGFNNGLQNSLWLGNDIIHVLTTKDSNVELRIDIWGDQQPGSPNPNGYWWEKYTNFFIDNEANFYTLNIFSKCSGNASTDTSPSMYWSNNWHFATIDSNKGILSECYSSDYQLGGWWFGQNCGWQALNGKYIPPTWGYHGFRWITNDSIWINPKQSRMMLRRLL